jgi:hypothetical protein
LEDEWIWWLMRFACQVRVSEEDLEKERGAVLEELRGSRNALGRMQEAHWVLMMKGSQVHCLNCTCLSPALFQLFIQKGLARSAGAVCLSSLRLMYAKCPGRL